MNPTVKVVEEGNRSTHTYNCFCIFYPSKGGHGINEELWEGETLATMFESKKLETIIMGLRLRCRQHHILAMKNEKPITTRECDGGGSSDKEYKLLTNQTPLPTIQIDDAKIQQRPTILPWETNNMIVSNLNSFF